MLRSWLLLLLLAPAGCATSTRERAALVYVSLAGSGPCTVDLEDRRYTLPADAAPLARESKRLAARTQGAIVGAGEEPLSFACWRESMAIIRAAGFARLGLVTAAPPPPQQQDIQPDPPRKRETPTAS